MEKNYFSKKSTFLLIILSLFIGQIHAQKKQNELKVPSNSLKDKTTKVYKTSQKELLFKEQLQLKTDDKIVFFKRESDKLGFTHERHQQYYKNVKVEFATPITHNKNGEIKTMSGEYYSIEDLNTSPKLSKSTALQKATSHIGASSYLWQNSREAEKINYKKPEGELVILPGAVIDQKENKLAYKFDVYATKPISRGYVYVDAQNGEVLFYNAIIKHANNLLGVDFEEYHSKINLAKKEDKILVAGTAATRYSSSRSIETSASGSNYILSDNSRGNGINTYDMNEGTNYNSAVNFSDNDNNWTAAEWDNTAKDNGALDAHWGAEMTYDYWQEKHGRNSFDNAGAAINSYIHYDSAYDNAFWDGSRMTYGDGSSNGTVGNGYFDILTSLDVAAHEIGHAVCSYTADLAYQRESGAMNEAFSDIWAAAIEYYAAPEKSTWLIGEDIERRTTSVALRSMSNPKDEGQPDTYGGTNWIEPNCGTPTNSNDYCGVHTNSGVLNHWFYILSVGKSGSNDIGSSYSVSGLGIDKAAQIAFRLESVYLSSSSTFANARTYGIQAAEDLYGEDSAEVIATTNAFYAVGVGNEYGDTSVSYCASASTNVNDEYISNVNFNTIDNASSGQFYSNFTAISTTVEKENTYTITITPTWTGTTYNEGYAVWIDYNQDGDFDDSGELVFSKAASKTTPVSGSVTIPSTAKDGATRMRVSMKYNGIPTACESFSYGEVEDYTVSIGAATADVTAPSDPTNLIASNVTETTVNLSWTASTDDTAVTSYNVYQNGTLISTVTSTTAAITNLTANTTYSFYVIAKDAAGNSSNASTTINVATLSNADTTAPSDPTNLIASNITETTVDLSWTASTDDTAVTSYDVYEGSTNIGSVTSAFAEITGLTANTAYSFSVIAKDAAGNSSNASNLINITTLTDEDTQAPSTPTNLVAADITQTSLNLSWTASTDDTAVTGYDVYQNGSMVTSVTNNTASITGLTANTAYSFYVIAKDAAGNVSSASNTINTTTLSNSGNSTDLLLASYFETGWDGWADGGSDAGRYNTSRSYEGNYSILIRDNSGTASSMTSPTLNISSYDTVDVEFYFYARSMETGEDFWLRYYNGSSWSTIATYAQGSEFANNGFYTATVTIDKNNYNFATNAQFRFQCDASNNVDYIYIDQVTVTGIVGSGIVSENQVSLISTPTVNSLIAGASSEESKTTYDGDLFLYPNPVKGDYLTVKILNGENTTYRISTILGQSVKAGKLNGVINVNSLKAGMYIIEVNNGEDVQTKKFIKQ